MYESHQDTSSDKHVFPEANTYDYASQLMFDANAFAVMSNQVDLNSASYLDFFQQGGDPYEMMRYQAAMQSHDYASSCTSNSKLLSSYNTQQQHHQQQQQQQQQHHHQQQQQQQPQQQQQQQTLQSTAFQQQTPPQQQQKHQHHQQQQQQQQQPQQAYPMMAFHNSVPQQDAMSLSLEHSHLNYSIPYDHHQAYLYNGGPMPSLSSSSSTISSLSSTAYATSSDRGAQVYVRKACVSCKQSHVACDVQRPCARCVRLNKADTCVDAERKKRGRPCGSSKKKKENTATTYKHLI